MFSQIVNTERLTDPGLVDRLASALAHTRNPQTTSLRSPTTDLAFVDDTLARVGAELPLVDGHAGTRQHTCRSGPGALVNSGHDLDQLVGVN